MKKILFTTLCVLSCAPVFCQMNASLSRFYYGSGPDTAHLVIDFKEEWGGSSYQWGILFDSLSGYTVGDLLDDLSAAESNLIISRDSADVLSIDFSKFHDSSNAVKEWKYFTDSAISWVEWDSSQFMPAIVHKGQWFGFSYCLIDTARSPDPATGVNVAADFIPDNSIWVIGSGTDTVSLIVDFLANGGSYAWAYAYNPPATMQQMLSDIALLETDLSIHADGGFLSDLVYQSDSGIGGFPNYWSSWTASNFGDFYMNGGLSEILQNGFMYGCTYTDYYPALMPRLPQVVEAHWPTAIPRETQLISVYPNPTHDYIVIESKEAGLRFQLWNNQAVKTIETVLEQGSNRIELSALAAGLYHIRLIDGSETQSAKLILH